MESGAFVGTSHVYNCPALQQQFDLVRMRTFIASRSVSERVKTVVRALVGRQAVVDKKSENAKIIGRHPQASIRR
jgi:hypothetical protein